MNQQTVILIINQAKDNFNKTKEYVLQNRMKVGLWIFIILIFWNKEIGWQLNTTNMDYSNIVENAWTSLDNTKIISVEETAPIIRNGEVIGDEWDDSLPTDRLDYEPTSLSIWGAVSAVKSTKTKIASKNKNTNNLANTFSNLTFWADNPKKKEAKSAKETKRQKQRQYVERFYNTAQVEMEKYGIPASITLAQGLLESNVGESRLATRNNNHFGIKCFSKKCKTGHCSNFTDDSHKDFFRQYSSAWESFRAHSKLLQAKRYKPLYRLRKTDYKAWAHGLKKAGYATDKKYASKIIQLIEDLGLERFDD